MEATMPITPERMRANTPPETVAEITNFYNAHFQPRTLNKNKERYRNDDAVNIVLKSDNKIVGLLESSKKSLRGESFILLETMLIDPDYRGRSLSRKIFDQFFKEIQPGQKVVVRFRDSNREHLERLYETFGFSQIEENGRYKNKEIKWKMILVKEDVR
jgi:predicted GNAT family N-acyltransferase